MGAVTQERGQPVLRSKTRAPQAKGLPRERLDAALGQLWEHRLGLIIAPAGSGKTTLLGHFVATAGVPVGWYRAEPADSSVAAAVAHLERALVPALDGLHGGWTDIDQAIDALEGWVGRRAVLVVDDLHALWGTEAEGALERLLEHLPPSLTVLAATRRLPGFDLSRLRVAGTLLEVTADDLRFRSWEVERLFRDVYGEHLPPNELAELARRTEGWAAGLQLFHLATSGKPAGERRRVLRELGQRSRPRPRVPHPQRARRVARAPPRLSAGHVCTGSSYTGAVRRTAWREQQRDGAGRTRTPPDIHVRPG